MGSERTGHRRRAFPHGTSGGHAFRPARLRKLLQATGRIEAWETDTHFLLGRLRNGQASALKRYLAEEHGILIRDASNFEGLDKTFFRMSTQRPEDNDRLAEAIAQWFEN